MSSDSSSYKQYGNPVLYNFVGFNVEPYWLVIVDLLVIQLLQRLNSLIESVYKKKKKNIYIALEISILGAKRTGISPPKYSVLDFILSWISVGHFGYACYLQTKCSSVANQSSWRCYNAFGYRLFNYVLPSIVSVLVESIIQLVNMCKAYKKDKPPKSTMGTIKWILVGTSIVINTLVFLVFIPFIFSNVVPMLIAYSWILFPILGGATFVYAIFITTVVNAIQQCQNCGCVYCLKFFGTHCVVGLQVFGCFVFSMAYNYSQYSYFGADFSSVMWYEYQSRDTTAWYNTLTNSSELVAHNILAAL